MAKILITSTNLVDPPPFLAQDLVFYEPLLKISKINTLAIENFLLHQQKNIDGIIVSSQNALLPLQNSFLNKNIKIFTVGKNTAQKIIALGYQNVFSPAEFGAEKLLEIILQHCGLLKDQHLIYLHGPESTVDFSAVLAKKYIKVSNFLAYTTTSSDFFSDSLQQFLTTDDFDKIFIFSSNSLLVFFHKMQNNRLQDKLMHTNIYCISQKVATLAKNYGFCRVLTFTL